MKKLISLFTIVLAQFTYHAQNVRINTTGATPDNSSILDVLATQGHSNT